MTSALEHRVAELEARAQASARLAMNLAKSCQAHAAHSEQLTLQIVALTEVIEKLTSQVEKLIELRSVD